MAAAPLGILLALGLPKSWIDAVGDIGDGVGDALDRAQTLVRGGDITGASGLTLALTVLGSTADAAPARRRAPRRHLYVTGRLGGPGAALRRWLRGEAPAHPHAQRFAHPVARIPEALWLARRGAHAAIDISDGLLADAEHMAQGERRAHADRSRRGAAARRRECPRCRRQRGGVRAARVAPPRSTSRAFERTIGVPLTAIGTRARARARRMRRHRTNARRTRWRRPGGFRHFS